MEFVRDNVVNFGGNPEEVTLWGQSAGAVSVVLHMASLRSAGLFNKVRGLLVAARASFVCLSCRLSLRVIRSPSRSKT